jgi:hypothetical protein
MKKYILTIMLFSLGFAGYAQVGIGTANPTLTLEIVGANDNGAVTGVDGVLVPRVNDTDMSSATAGTKEGQMVYNTVAKKFYYWSGTTWTAVGGVAVVTDDMTTTTTDGTEVSQLVYSTNASSTGYYYWTGAAWTALVPADPARTVTETSDNSYAIDLSDDIIVYGGGTASFTFPSGATIGKTFTIIAAGTGDITLDTLTDGSNTLPGGSGSTYIYLGLINGNEEWAALHSF